MWIHILYEFILCWRDSLFLGAITSLCLWSREGGKNGIALITAMVMSVIIILGVQIPAFGGCAQLAITIFDMMVVLAPAAWMRARTRTRAHRRSGMRLTTSSGIIAGAQQEDWSLCMALSLFFLKWLRLRSSFLSWDLLLLMSFLSRWGQSWRRSSRWR